MEVNRIAPGLWRWTAFHAAKQEPVGCVYWECAGQICLIDPLVPPEAREKFFSALDRDVARLRATVQVLLTKLDHMRSAEEFVARYQAELWAPAGERAAANADDAPAWLKDHVVVLPAGRAGEVIYWLVEHRTLVVGDLLRGNDASDSPDGALLLAADLPDPDLEALLDQMVDLEVERVLPAHGTPVWAKAGDELRALATRSRHVAERGHSAPRQSV